MGETNFNRRQCLRALSKLGFFLANKRSGGHDKYRPPTDIQAGILPPQRPFIMVPRHNNLECQVEIVEELKKMGGVELVERFKKFL